jgi:ribonucleotide monophosphatase NagD (HAD superfamily)
LKNVFSVEYSDDVAFGVTSKEERIFPTSFRNEHLPSDGEIAYVYLIGKPSRINLFSDIPNLESTDDLKKAHFVLLCDIPPIPPNSTINLASEDDIRSQYATLLKQCTIPILCVNPDVQAVVSSKIEFRPGYLADIYEKKHNGSVLYFGKPYRNIYEMATKKHNFKHEEVLCIGDNIYTDIRGATRAGLQTLLVTGGVHWSEIETLTKKGQTYENAVKSLCEEANLIPNYVVKFLM